MWTVILCSITWYLLLNNGIYIIEYHNIQFSLKLITKAIKVPLTDTITAAVSFALFKTRTVTKLIYIIYTSIMYVIDCKVR